MQNDFVEDLNLRIVFSTSFQEVHSFTSGKALPWGPQCAAMASCHSLILLDGTIQGDPLDLKMFEGTAWVRWLFLGSTEWGKCEDISSTHWECLGFPNFGWNPENHSSIWMNEGLILPESPNLCTKTLQTFATWYRGLPPNKFGNWYLNKGNLISWV